MATLWMVDRQAGDRRSVSVFWLDGVPLTHETTVGLPFDDIEHVTVICVEHRSDASRRRDARRSVDDRVGRHAPGA